VLTLLAVSYAPPTQSTISKQPQGHRLGTADEGRYSDTATATATKKTDPESIPPPLDPNLTADEREKIRADRAAAAEARLKKQGLGGPTKKKKPPSSDAPPPLVGPNSKPTMQWTL
jgi:hypothetical protein